MSGELWLAKMERTGAGLVEQAVQGAKACPERTVATGKVRSAADCRKDAK